MQNDVHVDTHLVIFFVGVPACEVVKFEETSDWKTSLVRRIVVFSVLVADTREPHVQFVGVQLDRRLGAQLRLGQVKAPAWVRVNKRLTETVPEVLVRHNLQRVRHIVTPHG